VRCPTENIQFLILLCLKTEAKVNQFNDLFLLVIQDVIKLQVSVSITLFVHVSNSTNKLFKDGFALIFGEPLVG